MIWNKKFPRFEKHECAGRMTNVITGKYLYTHFFFDKGSLYVENMEILPHMFIAGNMAWLDDETTTPNYGIFPYKIQQGITGT